MDVILCEQCGSNEFIEDGRYRICAYCETRYEIAPKVESTIALDDDVARLLAKCESDPTHARKYANLILDIDPCNQQALQYL